VPHRIYLYADTGNLFSNQKILGIFWQSLKLIARYDTVAAQHLDNDVSNPRSVLCSSHDTQNEFIELMGNAVRQLIIEEIRQSKYFSMMFDTTPDLAHREQMSEVIQYVHIHETNVEIKESFVDFFEIHEKTSEALATEILSKLDADGLRVEDCCGQDLRQRCSNARASNGRTDKDSRKESSCLIRSMQQP